MMLPPEISSLSSPFVSSSFLSSRSSLTRSGSDLNFTSSSSSHFNDATSSNAPEGISGCCLLCMLEPRLPGAMLSVLRPLPM